MEPRRKNSYIETTAWLAGLAVLLAGIIAARIASQPKSHLPPSASENASKPKPTDTKEAVADSREMAVVDAARKYIGSWARKPSFDGPLLGVQIAGDTARVVFADESESEAILEYDALRKRWDGVQFSYLPSGSSVRLRLGSQ